MALFYVTGAPGSGKTTLQKELERRGYTTRDIDNSGLGGPHNKRTGKRVVIPPAEGRSPEWFETHEWRVDPDAFEQLKAEATKEDIVLCGVAASDGAIRHLFDKILYLRLDDDTLRHRLKMRTDNDYGKNEFEVKEILERKRGLDATYAQLDVITINATKSLADVADQIVLRLR